MKKKILTLLIASLLLASSLFAADATAVDSKTIQQQTQVKVDMGADVANLNNAISSDSKPIATTTQDKRSAEEILNDVMENYIDQNNLRDRYDYVGSTIGTAYVNQKNRTMLIVCSLHLRKY